MMFHGVLLVLLCSYVSQTSAALNLRGVAKSAHASYKIGGDKFKCRDGQGEFSIDRVNDDFCDCFDGSDEPGTSACSRGVFYCVNRGHVGQQIFSSRVNDGICDCCDGSDEYEKHVQCQNNCMELGESRRVDLKKRAESLAAGVTKKNEYVRLAVTGMEAVRAQVAELKARLVTEQETRDAVEKVKLAAEEVEKAEQDVFKAKQEQERLEKERVANETAAAANAAEAATTEEAATPEAEAAATATSSEAEAEADVPAEEQVEWKEGWMRMDAPPEAVNEDGSAATPPAEGAAAEGAAAEGAAAEEEDDVDEGGNVDMNAPKEEKPKEEAPPKNEEAEKARTEFKAADDVVKDTERNIASLDEKLNRDLGPQKEFWPLLDKCFEYKTPQYTYEVCPYSKASQKEGGSSTNLGTFQGWGEGKSMQFKNGLKCWGGPDREVDVSLECGMDEVVLKVDEPERCKYTMVMTTPAACSAEEAQMAQMDAESSMVEEEYGDE